MQNRLFRTVCTSFRVFALGALVVGVVGCQNASDTLVNPLPPSVPGAANPVFNLTGTWSGTLSEEDGEQIRRDVDCQPVWRERRGPAGRGDRRG